MEQPSAMGTVRWCAELDVQSSGELDEQEGDLICSL